MKKIIVLLLITATLVFGCGKLSKKKVAQYKSDGLQFLAEGDYKSAIENLTVIIDYDDNEHSIAFALAEAYSGNEEYNKAIRTIEKIKGGDAARINKLIQRYKASNLLKDIAVVNWETYQNVDWDYVGSFSEDYHLYRQDGLYGLLDLSFNVVLEAQYANLSIWYGPYKDLITAYRTEKDFITNDYSKLVLLNRDLKETKKKFEAKKFGGGIPKEPFIDVLSGNLLVYLEEAKTSEGIKRFTRPVISLEEDKVVAAAMRDDSGDSLKYKFIDEFYLVNKKDMSVHRLTGIAQDHFYGFYTNHSVSNDMITVVDKNGKCGYYNLNTILVSAFQYDGRLQANRTYRCSQYSYNYVVVNADGLYGILDKNGNVVVKLEFDSISDMAFGKFIVIYQGQIGLAVLK